MWSVMGDTGVFDVNASPFDAASKCRACSLNYNPFPAKFASSLKAAGNMKEISARDEFLRINGFNAAKFTCMSQIHSSNVQVVDSAQAGEVIEECDALVTNLRGVPIGVLAADCVPVALADNCGTVAAVIHAGWRGLKKRIIEKTVDVISDKFNILPQKLKALICPHIQKCCYKTGEEFNSIFGKACDGGYCDLDLVARDQLKECGILSISSSERCTCHEDDCFFSYRRDKSDSRMLTAMQLI